MPRSRSQCASQTPSRPASNATTIRVIACPAFSASARHRSICACSSCGLPAGKFFFGCRLTPGTVPASSQLFELSSITHTSVLAWSKAA